MNVVIVCESMFGNTELLARAVALGLTDVGSSATVVDVRDVAGRDLSGCELLVIAAPTHALSLSRPETRAQAVDQGAEPARAVVGVREWLAGLDNVLPAVLHRPPVVVFDSRILKARHWPGSAAYRASRQLRKKGFTVVERTSFFVDAIAGPVSSGEAERARVWGAGLPELVRRRTRLDVS